MTEPKKNNNVKNTYEVFQNDCKVMDELFVKEFNSYCFYVEWRGMGIGKGYIG